MPASPSRRKLYQHPLQTPLLRRTRRNARRLAVQKGVNNGVDFIDAAAEKRAQQRRHVAVLTTVTGIRILPSSVRAQVR
jgi:hypothetical protein